MMPPAPRSKEKDEDQNSLPSVAGFEGQFSVVEFMSDYIEGEDKLVLDAGQAVSLFELGMTDESSVAFDLQDFIVLITMKQAGSGTCAAQGAISMFDVAINGGTATAREVERGEIETTRAPEPKRVLVVGAGPAGMEAARVAALRGHQVTLCEKADQLGGTLRFAALVYPPNAKLLRWLERQVDQLEIEVRTGFEMSAERVREMAPDVAILAGSVTVLSGLSHSRPPLPRPRPTSTIPTCRVVWCTKTASSCKCRRSRENV